MVKLRQLYTESCKRLQSEVGETAQFECFELIKAVFGMSRTDCFLHFDDDIDEEKFSKFDEMLTRRLNHEPLQYILGEWEFFGLPFKVGEGVLVPRGDTEIIAETAINLINQHSYKSMADLCSGSGALAISIGKNTFLEKIDAVELSEKAFSYLYKNINLNNMENKITAYNEDIFTFLNKEKYDIVVSNPPYIPTGDIAELSEEVHKEPFMALDGGTDGLYFYRRISQEYYDKINSGGALVFEIGIDELSDVMEIMKKCGYFDVSYINDYSGIPRCVYGIRK